MKKKFSICLPAALLWISLFLLSCSTSRKTVPVRSPLEDVKAEIAGGREVFMAHCQSCHPHGEAGLGLAINNKPLPGFMIRFQVRNGLGVMPSFKEEQISGEELDHLVAYLKEVRKNDD